MAKKDCVVNINGVDYVPKDSQILAEENGLPYCIVRTYSAGVFAGFVESQNGQEVKMTNARRLWRWYGAAEISQIAQEGIQNHKDSRIAIPTNVLLTQVIEIQQCTKAAKQNIQEAPIWKV